MAALSVSPVMAASSTADPAAQIAPASRSVTESLHPEEPAQPLIPVSSGQEVTLQEVLLDDTPGTLWARFRFVAPGIGRGVITDAAARDIDDLCNGFALDYIADNRLKPARIVISLAERALEFGTADPTVTQYFESYRAENGRCIWEGF